MSAGKEIRTQITSIKNTQKITSAMEKVAASKMRKAQQRMELSKPYATRIRQVIGHLAGARPEYQHTYMVEREKKKRVGFIVVSTDRGLCGGLNANLLKSAVTAMKDWHDKKIEIDLCLIGNKAINFFKNKGGNIVGQARHLNNEPSITELVGIVKVMLDAYADEKIDALYVCYNDFVNTMSQKPHVMQLLPLVATEKSELQHYWDYIYEPDAKELITTLITRYIESQVYQAVIENMACEQAARMVAMKSATDNAGDLIKELQMDYNKARQASITQELSEIVAGSAAV